MYLSWMSSFLFQLSVISFRLWLRLNAATYVIVDRMSFLCWKTSKHSLTTITLASCQTLTSLTSTTSLSDWVFFVCSKIWFSKVWCLWNFDHRMMLVVNTMLEAVRPHPGNSTWLFAFQDPSDHTPLSRHDPKTWNKRTEKNLVQIERLFVYQILNPWGNLEIFYSVLKSFGR